MTLILPAPTRDLEGFTIKGALHWKNKLGQIKDHNFTKLSPKYFVLNVRNEGELFIKVCIFLKFKRHFEISRADADFQRFRFHDVSECFITAGNYKHVR